MASAGVAVPPKKPWSWRLVKRILISLLLLLIPLERPDAVVAAVREVCDDMRSQVTAKPRPCRRILRGMRSILAVESIL